MKKSMYWIAIGSLAFGSASWACSGEDADAKAQEFDAAVAELSKTDPVKAVTVSAKVTDEKTRQATEGSDNEALCALYDELLADLRGTTTVEEPEVSLEAIEAEAIAEEPGH